MNIKGMKSKIDEAFTVRDAMETARFNPSAFEEAHVKGIIAKLSVSAKNPDLSKEAVKTHVMSVRYDINLKEAYRHASDNTRKEAATNIAAMDSFEGSYWDRRPHIQRALVSVLRMVREHESNSRSASSNKE